MAQEEGRAGIETGRVLALKFQRASISSHQRGFVSPHCIHTLYFIGASNKRTLYYTATLVVHLRTPVEHHSHMCVLHAAKTNIATTR